MYMLLSGALVTLSDSSGIFKVSFVKTIFPSSAIAVCPLFIFMALFTYEFFISSVPVSVCKCNKNCFIGLS